MTKTHKSLVPIITVKNNHVYLGLPKQAVQINNKTDRGMVAEYRKPAEQLPGMY